MTDESNTPQPGSNRTLAGGTPEIEVLVRVRARTAAAALERVERWAHELEGHASVESVEVELHEPDPES